MTTFKFKVLVGVLALGLVVSSFAIALPAAAAGNGPGNGNAGIVTTRPGPAPILSQEEKAGLIFMREEEKLARDVYITLGNQWNFQTFTNIAPSEQNHMDAVGTLLARYGIADPAAGKGIGQFTNPKLQALYNQLVQQGSVSLGEALKVGALIEETDIEDLLHELTLVRHNDIKQVYTQLEQGSENHLRAFVRSLAAQTGEVYQPQVLDQATYDAIISGSNGGPGPRGRQGQGNGQFQGRGSMQGQGNGTCIW